MENNLKRYIFSCSIFLIGLLSVASAQVQTIKPWTYWWWMGSAVNKNDLKYELLNFKKAGIGGVHIIPIYGVKGYENQFKDFLSPEWIKIYEYTLNEAKKLGLGVDISTGTGWLFGGPNVTKDMAAKKVVINGNKFTSEPTLQKVKRAAPGGEGYVLDPFSKKDMIQYLSKFDSTIVKYKSLRSFYYDSYEVYNANWTNDFLREFKKRRGYDLPSVKGLFTDTKPGLNQDLVRIDYQQTLSELLLETIGAWGQWSNKNGFKTRYEAHGSPGNLIDLYAVASIPETEIYGSSAFPIPYLRADKDYSETSGRPNVLVMKFASSAANLSGKALVSSETCTWLADHFKVSLSQVKPQVDELFTGGINHIFFQGTTFSPKAEKYPGWLFYASTNFGATSHFYKELPLLNEYITNCQRILQRATPDNDILVYFPIQDIWADAQSAKYAEYRVHMLNVHWLDKWLFPFPLGKIAAELKEGGFTFDYISDAFLKKIEVKGKTISISNNTYKTLVVPDCSYMPESTIKQLIRLAQKGVTIIFDKSLPKSTTGYSSYQQTSQTFEKDKQQLMRLKNCIITGNLKEDLKKNKIQKETMVGQGLSFIRKKLEGKRVYFITNLGDKFKSGWVGLSSSSIENYSFYDPLTNEKEHFTTRKKGGRTQIYLTLLPGQSCFVMEEQKKAVHNDLIPSVDFGEFKINTDWKLQFLEGRPAYKRAFKLDSLQSWTTLSDTASFFSGTAVYSGLVDIPDSLLKKKELILYLGDVKESAAVTINGRYIGTAWSLPFQIKIPNNILKAGVNKLDIEGPWDALRVGALDLVRSAAVERLGQAHELGSARSSLRHQVTYDADVGGLVRSGVGLDEGNAQALHRYLLSGSACVRPLTPGLLTSGLSVR